MHADGVREEGVEAGRERQESLVIDVWTKAREPDWQHAKLPVPVGTRVQNDFVGAESQQ